MLIGYLDNVATGSDSVRRDFVASARLLGRQVVILSAGTEQEIDIAFDAMAKHIERAPVIHLLANAVEQGAFSACAVVLGKRRPG